MFENNKAFGIYMKLNDALKQREDKLYWKKQPKTRLLE